jgi:transposase-like protein
MRHNMQIIWQSLYWYFHHFVSLREVIQLLFERGVEVSHVTIYNWILKFTPKLEKKFIKINFQ